MPTIRDVAREAGVSVSTVSLVLNSPDRVSDATRHRVLAAVDALGFVPKADAVARARHGVGRIGVLAPYSSYPSVARRLTGVLEAVDNRAIEVVLFDQESAAHRMSPLLGSLPVTGRLDGVIVVSLPLEETVAQRLRELRLATVLIDVRHAGFDSVHTDDAAGGRLVAEHLLARGHRRFAFLGEAQESDQYVSPSQRRLDGYRTTLAEAGHDLHEAEIRLSGHHLGSALAAARELLSTSQPRSAGRSRSASRPHPTREPRSEEDRPTAVFAADDTLAAGVMRAAHELGLAVPADLAVVGFDDGELAEALGLTTVRQPLEASGRTATEMLLSRLEHQGPPREVTLGLELIIRGSTD